jgi:phage-related protein (TIGR01555 family)
VSDLIHAFTVFVLKTNLTSLLANADAMIGRLTAFIFGRDNKGLMLVDKETEELENVSAPLGSLDKLQAQSQEQMASVNKEPLIKMLGITPSGLNATSDSEIRNWYDHVRAVQESTLGDLVTTALSVIQLSETGAIDPDISYEFVPLWELDEAGKAAVEKTKADTDSVYMAGSVISNEEVRTRLAGDPSSPYHGLEGDAPEPMDDMAGENDKEDDADRVDRGGAEGSETGANSGV